jgi:hypothetical protein
MRSAITVVVTLFGAFFLVSGIGSPVALAGKIVVNHDEWTLSDMGFDQAPDAGQFALNIAGWFTGGVTGGFLVYSANVGLVGINLANTMTNAGHSWTIVNPTSSPLPDLSQFDAVFLAGPEADNPVLIDYVNAGGNVYLAGGPGEAAAWNVFLNAFNLFFEEQWNNVFGTLPISSPHPIFSGVSALFQDNGNSVGELDPSDPRTDVLEFFGPYGLYTVFDSTEPISVDATSWAEIKAIFR